MADVTIQVNGKNYPVACEAGQEDRIAGLGAEIDERVRSLTAGGVRAADSHLLVMAALLLADERDDARAEARTAAQNALAEAGAKAATQAESHAESQAAAGAEAAESLAGSLESLTRRIEAVAERIEAA